MNNENIIVIATTNNIKNFDPALLRSGRLSQVILVDNPSLNERIDILEKLFKAKNLKIMANQLLERHNGEVPSNFEDLENLITTTPNDQELGEAIRTAYGRQNGDNWS